MNAFFIGVLVALFLVGFIMVRRSDKKEFERKMDDLTMPCGEIVPEDAELMDLSDDELNKFSKADINWLINYVGHKMSETCGQEYKDWGELFTRLSAVKTKNGWHKEPYPVDY